MSTEKTLDIYQLNSQSGKSGSSSAAVDVVVDNLGEAIGKAEAGSIFAARAKGRPMLLHNPPKESRARVERKAKAARQKEDKSRRKVNSQSGGSGGKRVSSASIQGLKYQTFVEIHTLWAGYMSELLNLPALTSINEPLDSYVSSHALGMQTKLVKADFHGCKLTVKASKCPTLVGSSGIVIEETANVFRIITSDDRTKGETDRQYIALRRRLVLPKQNSIFTFNVPLHVGHDGSAPQLQFELYGNQFRFRSDDRASRKFKSKETIEL